jgi:hypothetical protein
MSTKAGSERVFHSVAQIRRTYLPTQSAQSEADDVQPTEIATADLIRKMTPGNSQRVRRTSRVQRTRPAQAG